KLWGLGLDPVGPVGFLSLPEVQLAIIEFEVFLGVWLWTGQYPIGAWLAGIATFAAFAGVSMYLGLIGQSSCGCAGGFVKISPWVAFAIDLTVVSLLGLGWKNLSTLQENLRAKLASGALSLLCALGTMAVASGVVFGLAHVGFGSVPAAIAYFRGERVSAQRLVEVEDGCVGESHRVCIAIANWTDKPIRLIGGSSDCSCTILEDLPVVIPALETRAVPVEIALSGRPGLYTRKVGFYVEDEGLQVVSVLLTGRILQSK